MAEARPADDARDVHDDPDKADTESPEERGARHEELHREHRERLDEHDEHIDEHHGRLTAVEKLLGIRREEREREERGERKGSGMRQRRRHD